MILTKLCHNFSRQNTANDHTDSPTQDMTLSNTVNEEFRVHLNNTSTNLNGVGYAHLTKKIEGNITPPPSSQVDMSVRVLTTGFWPGQNAPPHINLPRIPAQVHTSCAHLVPTYTYSPRPLMSSRTSILQSTAEEFSHCNLALALQTSTPFSLVK